MLFNFLNSFSFGLVTQISAIDQTTSLDNAYNLINNTHWFYFSNLITITGLITIIVLLSICFSNTSSNVKLLNIISAYFLSIYLYTSSLNFDLNLLTHNLNKINNQNLTFFFNLFIFIAIITTIIFFLSISNKFFIEENSKIEFSLLIWTILISAIFLISTTDFISIIILLECISFSSYILVGFARKNKYSTSSALKYLIIASIPGGLFILGISLFYFNFGSFSQDYLTLILTNILNFKISKENFFDIIWPMFEQDLKEREIIYDKIVFPPDAWLLHIFTLKEYSNNTLHLCSQQLFVSLTDLLAYYNSFILAYIEQLNDIMTYISVTSINDYLTLDTLEKWAISTFKSDFHFLRPSGKINLAQITIDADAHRVNKEIQIMYIFNELIALQSLLQLYDTLYGISLLTESFQEFPQGTLTPIWIPNKKLFFETFPTIGVWLQFITMLELERFQFLTKTWFSTVPDKNEYHGLKILTTTLEKAYLKTDWIFDSGKKNHNNIQENIFQIHKISSEKQQLFNTFSIGELFYYLEACRLQIVYVFIKTINIFANLESSKIMLISDENRITSTIKYLNTVYTHNYFIASSLKVNLLDNLTFENLKYNVFPIREKFLNFNNQLKAVLVNRLYNDQSLYFYPNTPYQDIFAPEFSQYAAKDYVAIRHNMFTEEIYLYAINFIKTLNKPNFLIIYLALILILSNLAFKLTAAPFHLWAPSIYGGSPLATLTYLSIFSKLTIIFFSIWLFSNTFDILNEIWEPLFLIMAFLSIFFSILGAFSEKFFKRFFIYSSMGHVGFMLIGLAVLNLDGLKGTIDYLILYIISSFIVWFIIMHLTKKTMTLINLKGLAYNYPNLSMVFTITLFSLSGIPPLGGFFVKYEIFYSIISSSFFWFGYILLLLTVISFFYYIRLIKIFYFENLKIYFINKNFDDIKLRLISLLFFIIPFFIFYADNAFSFILQNILKKSLF